MEDLKKPYKKVINTNTKEFQDLLRALSKLSKYEIDEKIDEFVCEMYKLRNCYNLTGEFLTGHKAELPEHIQKKEDRVHIPIEAAASVIVIKMHLDIIPFLFDIKEKYMPMDTDTVKQYEMRRLFEREMRRLVPEILYRK